MTIRQRRDSEVAPKYKVTLTATVEIEINDPDAIHRVTGPGGDEWRSQLYDLHTLRDVLNHFAYNAVANGQVTAKQLDGWADLPRNAVQFEVVEVEEAYDEDIEAVEADGN